MTIYTVTTTNDELDDLDGSGSVSVENFGGAGDISLREAIALANADSDADTIRFAGGAGEAFENAALLRLTQGELLITADLTIDGSFAGAKGGCWLSIVFVSVDTACSFYTYSAALFD